MKSDKILLPNGSGEMTLPQVNAELQEAAELDGPRFEEVAEKIDAAHKGGWGERLRSVLSLAQKTAGSKKYTAIALGVAVLLAGAFITTSITQHEAQSLNVAATETNTPVTNEATIDNRALASLQESASYLTQTAQEGEGTTHLARKTVKAHAAAQGAELSAEQLVYAEDALRKTVETQPLEVGQQVQFSQANVEAAYNAALQLEPWQLENLSKYVQ